MTYYGQSQMQSETGGHLRQYQPNRAFLKLELMLVLISAAGKTSENFFGTMEKFSREQAEVRPIRKLRKAFESM